MLTTPRSSNDPPATAHFRDLPVTVVMNVGSGRHDKSAAQEAIRAALAEAADARLIVARSPGELTRHAEAAARERPGVLAAAGGDGTLNAIASIAQAHDLPFGLIPLGTFNYFARELGIALDPALAARQMLDGAIRRLAVGRVNGRLFLNNASIGLYRRLLEQRELDKRRFGRSRLVALFSGIAFLLREHRPYRLRLSIDGKPLELSTLTVFFGRNPLQMEQLGLDEAECVARGEMAVLALREVGRLELAGLALRGALARLETAANLRQYCALTVTLERVDRRPGHLRVAVDGELFDATLPLVVESVPDALQVVVPRDPLERA